MGLTLGAYRKSVTVDADARIVLVEKRWFYFLNNSHRIPFEEVKRIDYSHDSIPTSWDWFGETKDELDKFRVSLVLKSDDEVFLWGFYGEGAVYTGWSGVFMGDAFTDLVGDQENAAHGYAKVLCAMLEKKLI